MPVRGEVLNPTEALVFLSIYEAGYSRSWTYFNGIQRVRGNTFFVKIRPESAVQDLVRVRRQFPKDSKFIVMSPSQIILPLATIILNKRLILDAGWSLFEGTYISRGKKGFLGAAALKNYIIDLVSSQLARKVLVESELQKEFYKRMFLLSYSKVEVLYTGVDESAFKQDESFVLPSSSGRPIVLFRGKYNPEAGLDVLANATHLLADFNVQFWIFSPGLPSSIQFAGNALVDRKIYTKQEIARIQMECVVSLGQLANHSRLRRTIPHKAFESAYLATPYLTARNSGVLELFDENRDIACFNPGDAIDLAEKIRSLLGNLETLEQLGDSMKRTYAVRCSQEILSKKFMAIVGAELV